MSFGSGGGSTATPTTTTTSTQPWSATAQQGLNEAYQGAQDLYAQGPPAYYPDSTTVPFSGQTETALQGTEATAMNPGGGVLPTAVGHARNIMSGGMLNENPWLDRTFDRAANAVQGRLGSTFGRSAGGYGSGMHRAAMGSTMNDLATGIYGENYARERGAQDAMLSNAGTFEEMRYDPSRRMAAVGAAREGQAGNELNADIARWNYNQNAPQDALSRLLAQLSGGNFATSTSTGQSFSNPLLAYGGLAAQLASAIGNWR